MNSFVNASVPPEKIALFDEGNGTVVTYGELRDRCRRKMGRSERELVFIFMQNTIPMVLFLLSQMSAGNVVCLLNPSLPLSKKRELIDSYLPDLIVCDEAEVMAGRKDWEVQHRDGLTFLKACSRSVKRELHADLSILLSTSGTTGGPKLVRLSFDNIFHNIRDVCKAIEINDAEIAVASLPMHYSFGLSVLLTHLHAGAGVLITDSGLMSGTLWEAIRKSGVTTLSCVPSHLEILSKLKLERLNVPSIRKICQAGGRADPGLLDTFHAVMEMRGGALYVMYGQTEASPRMTTLPSRDFHRKRGSVGPAIGSGRLTVTDNLGTPLMAGDIGEIVYEGPNVMMGYALEASDLHAGNLMKGRLRTGDLGFVDDEGYLFITGRSSRFAKVAGLRIGLDEIESILSEKVRSAAIDGEDRIVVAVEPLATTPHTVDDLLKLLYEHTSAPLRTFEILQIDQIPLKANGKIDYQEIKRLSDAR